MAIFNPSTLTLETAELKSSAEAVFESAFAKPQLDKLNTIVNGIMAKQKIAILGRFQGLLGAGSGECDPSASSTTIKASQKIWDPATISDRLTYCWTDLQETFFIWGLKKGVQKADLTGTEFLVFVEELLSDALIETYLRIAYFNDKDAAATNDSPAGNITAGTNLAFFNRIDGIWKQIYSIVAADSARLTTGLASRNGQASFAAQAFTDTDTTSKVVTKTLQNMKFGSDMRLRGKANLVYIATQSVVDQYERELIASEANFTINRLENGFTVLKNGGIEVIGFDFWDRIIRAYFSNGTKYYQPHRIILSTPENLQIGTEESSALSSYDIFYDKKTKTTNVDFSFNLDAKVVEDHMVQVAY